MTETPTPQPTVVISFPEVQYVDVATGSALYRALDNAYITSTYLNVFILFCLVILIVYGLFKR